MNYYILFFVSGIICLLFFVSLIKIVALYTTEEEQIQDDKEQMEYIKQWSQLKNEEEDGD